jgi:hypothetical protein
MRKASGARARKGLNLRSPSRPKSRLDTRRNYLYHAAHFSSLAALTSALLLITGHTHWEGAPGALATGLIAGLLAVAVFAAYVRSQNRRETELTHAARLDGVMLAANAFHHHIGNKLAVAVGYSEMLAEDPRLPTEVQEQAQKVLTSALAAAAVVHKLDKEVVRIELDSRVAGPQLLDVDASTDKKPR